MTYKTLVASLILFSLSNLYSQKNKTISDSIYQNFGKKAIINATYAYMLDVSNGNKLSNSETEGLIKFSEKYVLKNNSYQNINLKEVSYFLDENSWPATNKNIFVILKNKYKRRQTINKQFFIIPGIGNSYKNWKKVTNELINNNSIALKKTSLKNENITKNNSINKIQKHNQIGKKIKNNGNTYFAIFFKYLVIIFLIAGVFTLATYKYLENKIFEILANEKDEYLKGKYSNKSNHKLPLIKIVEILKIRKKELKDKSNDFSEVKSKNQIKKSDKPNINNFKKDELKTQVKGETKKENESKDPISNSKYNVIDNKSNIDIDKTHKPIHEEKTKKLSLFFDIPEIDGSFNLLHGVTSFNKKKFFRIDFEENNNVGSITFLSSNKDVRAIKRREVFLDPVCDIENKNDSDISKNIELLEPGSVNLINNKWVIDPDNKVKIRLV